jgi:hypothetical protein
MVGDALKYFVTDLVPRGKFRRKANILADSTEFGKI